MVKKQFFSQLATLETLFKYWDEGKMVDIKVIDTTVENVIDDIIDDIADVRPVGWGVLWVRTNPPPPPPTEAIEFHLAWLKQGSKVCKDNKPYAAICLK